MKKVLTILLALLVVTGVVFAALPENATLTLSSSVDEVLRHGFFEGKATVAAPSFGTGQVNVGETEVDSSVTDVDMSGTAVELGHYNFWTNSSTNVTVSFALASLSTTVGTTKWYAPYKLTIATVEYDGVRFEENHTVTASLGDNTLASSAATDPLANAGGAVFSSTGSGNGYLSLKLTAAFNEGNADVLPQGTYGGTIIASIDTL